MNSLKLNKFIGFYTLFIVITVNMVLMGTARATWCDTWLSYFRCSDFDTTANNTCPTDWACSASSRTNDYWFNSSPQCLFAGTNNNYVCVNFSSMTTGYAEWDFNFSSASKLETQVFLGDTCSNPEIRFDFNVNTNKWLGYLDGTWKDWMIISYGTPYHVKVEWDTSVGKWNGTVSNGTVSVTKNLLAMESSNAIKIFTIYPVQVTNTNIDNLIVYQGTLEPTTTTTTEITTTTTSVETTTTSSTTSTIPNWAYNCSENCSQNPFSYVGSDCPACLEDLERDYTCEQICGEASVCDPPYWCQDYLQFGYKCGCCCEQLTTTTIETTTTVCPSPTGRCCFVGDVSGNCCLDDNFLYTQKEYSVNGTFYKFNETTFCSNGCDSVLNICQPTESMTLVYVVVLIILVVLAWVILKKLIR